MIQTKRRLGGWQCWVDIHDYHVIKTFKSKEEIKEEVEKFLKWENKLEELEERTDKVISDIQNSTRIIKKSRIPKRLIADLEFLDNGKVKQKRVLVLHEKLNELNNTEKKELIDKISDFLLELWKYGIHEKTFKIFSNLGIDKDDLVLIDVFELSSNKKRVLKQIKKRQWSKVGKYKKEISPELVKYLVNRLDKTLTEENLERCWNIK